MSAEQKRIFIGRSGPEFSLSDNYYQTLTEKLHAAVGDQAKVSVVDYSDTQQLSELAETPDVFIIGLRNPLHNIADVEHIKQLKEPDGPWSRVPIIVFSGYSKAEFGDRALEAGANYYIERSADIEKDIASLAEAINELVPKNV